MMLGGGGRGRKREYDGDSRHRDDRQGFQSKRARGSYSSRGSYNNSRGSYSSSSRGSYNSGSRGSYNSSSRGSYSSGSRGSYSSGSRGSYGSGSRGSYSSNSGSRGSYNSSSRGSVSRGSYSSGSRGSYKSDSRGSYSPRGYYSSRGEQRQGYDDGRRGSYNSRQSGRYSGRGSTRVYESRQERETSRETFRSPSSDGYRGYKKFSNQQDSFRQPRSPSYSSSRERSSDTRYSNDRFQRRDSSYRGGRSRGSFKQRFPRERSSRPPYSRDRGSRYSQYRGRIRTSFEKRPKKYSRSPSPNKSYHGSDMSDEEYRMEHEDGYRSDNEIRDRKRRGHRSENDEKHYSDDEDQEDKDRFPVFDTLTEVKPEEESEARKADLAAIVLRLLMDEGGHMKVHDLEMELITSKNIQFSTSEDFEKFLSENKDLFKVHTIEVGDMSELGEKSVTGHSKIEICRTHSKYAGSCNDADCSALHLCKYRVLSACTRYRCIYGHDVRRDAHNKKVLRDHMLHRLSFTQLQQMFRNLYNRQGINIPLVCSFYNSEARCRSEFRSNRNWKPCPFLHICEKFLTGSCNQLGKCNLSHNIYEKETYKILERYGLNPDDYSGGKREIMRFLKNKCKTSSTNDAASDVYSVHEDDYSDEEYKSWDEDDGDEEEHPEGEEEHPEEGEEEHEEGEELKDDKEGDLKNDEGEDVEGNGDTVNEQRGTDPDGEEQQKDHDEAQQVIEDEDVAGMAVSEEFGDPEHGYLGEGSELEQSQDKGQNGEPDTAQEETMKSESCDVTDHVDEKIGESEEIMKGQGTDLQETSGVTRRNTKTSTKLQLVKGNRRRVKQTTKVKARHTSNEDNQAGDIDEKCLAVWEFSLMSQEEWKGVGEPDIKQLEEKYQQYLESKMHHITIEDIEYKVDFSTFEGNPEAEDKEAVKLKRHVPT